MCHFYLLCIYSNACDEVCLQVCKCKLILQLSAVVSRSVNETSPLPGTAVHNFNDVNQILRVCHWESDLVVIPSSHINHDVLISVEKHDCTRVGKLVILIKCRNLRYIDKVDDCKVLHQFCNFVECFIHYHARRIRICAPANDDDSLFFTLQGLVYIVCSLEMWQKVRHG